MQTKTSKSVPIKQLNASIVLQTIGSPLTLKEVFTNEWSFYFNGTLCFDLTDFFVNYNRVLTSGLEHYNHWVKESHLGHIDPEKLNELKQLLHTL